VFFSGLGADKMAFQQFRTGPRSYFIWQQNDKFERTS
jgi:hypothetical protein